jgi:photosystem II stability/assembly factor-like uncharacterized protein
MIPRTLLAFVALSLLPAAWGAGPETRPLEEISHRDKLYDIAARGDDVFVTGYPGLLLVSRDRGKSFQVIDPGTRDALFSIDLNASGIGVVVGRGGMVLVTSDGGKSWQREKSPVHENLFGVALTPAGGAWAVGNFGTIIHSPDAGKSWQKQEYDASPPMTEEGRGGAVSTAEKENEGAAEEARLNAVAFVDDQQGWIVGEFGMVLHTTDGGASWKRQPSASGKLLFCLLALDSNKVLAAGSEGTLMETSDGGLHWRLVDTGVSEHILGLWKQGSNLFLVGRDGLILRRGEDGRFEHLRSGLYTWLNAVRFLDARVGFAVGGRGFLLETSDGGESWRRLSGR